jgi:hypothetical protein
MKLYAVVVQQTDNAGRTFAEAHHRKLLEAIACIRDGYTLTPFGEGGWYNRHKDEIQEEAARLLLYTAKNRAQARNIADCICRHYDQEVAMFFEIGQNLKFRDRRENKFRSTGKYAGLKYAHRCPDNDGKVVWDGTEEFDKCRCVFAPSASDDRRGKPKTRRRKSSKKS